jgi:hypothetical protein
LKVWGLYWRYLISIAFALLLLAFLFERIDVLNEPANTTLLPTFAWASITLLFALICLVQNKGFAYLFFGRRLELSTCVWRWFNASIIVMFIGLSLLAWLVNALVDADVWGLYKLYVQPSIMLLFPLISACYVLISGIKMKR